MRNKSKDGDPIEDKEFICQWCKTTQTVRVIQHNENYMLFCRSCKSFTPKIP